MVVTRSGRAVLASDETYGDAVRAQAVLRNALRGRRGVCGVGLTCGPHGYAVRVNVVDDVTDLPSQVDGIPVEVRRTGAITATGHVTGRRPSS